MSTKEADRQNILKQMKVRTTFKKDKSWIHQDSEDERDEAHNQMSPQLKSLEGKKFLWSPTPDSGTERTSETFTASSPPVHARNKQNTYSSVETNKSTYVSSQPSPPPSTTGSTKTPSYIIRGQPFNSVSQVKGQSSYNGYQKSYSTAQPRTSSSLPRVPTATGYKMSTEEYKKLAPYNVRNKSGDFSDDETLYTQEQQTLRTEQASKVLKSTAQRDRSYVTSAAKRSGGESHVRNTSVDLSDDEGLYTEEQPPRTEQTSKGLKSPPPRDNSYVTSAAKKSSGSSYNLKGRSADLSDDETLYTQEQPPRTEQTSKMLKTTPPRDSSFVTSAVKGHSGTGTEEMSPFVAKRVQIQEEENSPTKKSQTLPKTLSSYLYEDNKTVQIPEEENTPNKKSQTLPKTLSSYLYEDNRRFENNWKETQSKPTSSQTTPSAVVTDRSSSPQLTSYSTSNVVETKDSTIKPGLAKVTFIKEGSDKNVSKPTTERELPASTVTARKERVETTRKSDTLPESLASYLYDDVHRFEKNFKSNQSSQPTSQIVTKSEPDRPESPRLTAWNTHTESKAAVHPEPGRVTVFRESNTSQPNSPSITPRNTETKNPAMQSGPGKRTALKEDSKDVPDSLKLTSSSLPTSAGDSTRPTLQAGPGKVTVFRDKSDVDNSKVTNKSTEIITTTTGRAKITIETLNESTSPNPISPIPAPRMETKPREAATVKTSDKQQDLISWSDLDNNTSNTSTRITKETSVTPTPVPVQPNKASEKSAGDSPLTIITPELKTNRTNEPTKPGLITTVDDTKVTESRYCVPESLDEQEYKNSNNKSTSASKRVTSEPQPERPRTPEPRSSSPRPMPRPRETTAVTESRYRVPETLDDTMLQTSPSRSSSRTTVTTTRSTEPVFTEYTEDAGRKSTRTVSSSTEKTTTTTTTDTRYENSSASEASHYDPQSPSNKGVLFVKEYVNSRESLKSPTTSGGFTDYLDDSERLNYSSSSSYLYGSAPDRSDEGPCTYCGREIKDCPKIILEHLNIHCHEYCFKCGICNKPMGDLVDSLFIHRDVVHCESCYEKLF